MTAVTPSRAFTLNGEAVAVRADHPHLLAALREELDVTSPKDGCSPSGQCGCCTVLVDGKAVVSLPAAADQGRRASRSSPSRASTPSERQPLRRRLRRLRRPAVRLLHPRHRDAGQGADRQEGRRPHPRGHGPPPRRPPVPLHRLREDPRRHRGRRRRARSCVPERPVASARSGAKYEAGELALGDRGYVDDLRVPGHAPRRAPPHRPRPRRRPRASTPPRRAAAPGVVAVFTAADIPGELRVGHHPQGLAGA